jgi:hypothetical protein
MKHKKQCGSCYWFEPGPALPQPNDPNGQGGVCMFNIPVAVPMMQQSPLARPGQAMQTPAAMGIRPPVGALNRCHHWSLSGNEFYDEAKRHEAKPSTDAAA